jgi:hypothetical protein
LPSSSLFFPFFFLLFPSFSLFLFFSSYTPVCRPHDATST